MILQNTTLGFETYKVSILRGTNIFDLLEDKYVEGN